MFGPKTTGGAIDAFESRFTNTAVGHFMIAANGKESYPISEAESIAFRALYRRRMMRARWIRRAVLFGFIPFLILLSNIIPPWLGAWFQWVPALTLLGAVPAALIQHPITSDLTKMAIERSLKHRITTRFAPAVTPVATPLGRFAKSLLVAAFGIEVAIMLFHALRPRAELAEHMRVLTGLTAGNEGWVARLTGNLSWFCQLSLLAGGLLLMLDRRNKRAAARAKAAEQEGRAASAA